MEIIDAINSRRAVRNYTDAPISREVIEKLIDMATRAPSAMNHQPWAFAVICGVDRLREMSKRCKRYALDYMPENSPLHQYLANPRYEIFHGAPALIVICARDTQAQSAEDCCLAAQNLMLATHAEGLGTCWIGLSRPWLNQSMIKNELNIPTDFIPVAPIILGHPQGNTPPTSREPARIIWRL